MDGFMSSPPVEVSGPPCSMTPSPQLGLDVPDEVGAVTGAESLCASGITEQQRDGLPSSEGLENKLKQVSITLSRDFTGANFKLNSSDISVRFSELVLDEHHFAENHSVESVSSPVAHQRVVKCNSNQENNIGELTSTDEFVRSELSLRTSKAEEHEAHFYSGFENFEISSGPEELSLPNKTEEVYTELLQYLVTHTDCTTAVAGKESENEEIEEIPSDSASLFEENILSDSEDDLRIGEVSSSTPLKQNLASLVPFILESRHDHFRADDSSLMDTSAGRVENSKPPHLSVDELTDPKNERIRKFYKKPSKRKRLKYFSKNINERIQRTVISTSPGRWLSTGYENRRSLSALINISVEGVRLVERGGNNTTSSSGGTGNNTSTRSKPSAGILYLTATHLIFVDSAAKKETWILHMHISTVEKLALSTQGSPLHIRCKTFLSVTFIIPKERDCHEIFTALLQLSQPSALDDLFCFHYMNSSAGSEDHSSAGWDLYSASHEFERMGVPNSAWVPTTLNTNYEICDTYPQELYVPASAPTKVIIGSSKFRSKGRFPALTYLHKNQAALCRCSQPLSGFSARCLEDEQMLEAIRKANRGVSHMTVVDTRPKINAIANRATGKGYENEAFYENIKFHFTGIENIHVMRSSLSKLIDTCQLVSPTMTAWLSGVEGSGWLRHVRSVLESGVLVAKELASGVSVLVHCSDGWDRTAQTCALAQILLDPFYRTIHGFQILLEKEWLSFGYKFTDRSGLIQGEAKEVSPIFTQFLECVWQLQQMYPTSFEFNERYLLVLHDHVFSAQFGTFVGNCQKDRVDLRLSERTVSLWAYLSSQVMEHTNPLYRKDSLSVVLTPSLAPQAIQFWRGLYCRYWSGVHPREPLCDLLSATQDHSKALAAQSSYITKRLAWLSEQLRSRGGDPHNKQPLKQQLDNRLLDATLDQNGHLKNDPLGAFSMRQLEDSLTTSIDHSGNPVLIQTSPDKCDTAIAPPPLTPDSLLPTSPTKGVDSSTCISTVISNVALDWQSLRCVTECSCSTPFHAASRKHHCWMCGEVFCTRCIDKRANLPGHVDLLPAPVCRPCYKAITRSLSVDTP